MRGEEGLRTTVGIVVQVFDDRPGDGDAVIGAGATPQLVEEDERTRCEGVEDAGSFLHLDHKGRFASRDIVRSSDTGEDAIGESEVSCFGWDEGAYLCQEDDECSLAEEGGFTAHIRPCDDHDLRLCFV